MGGRGRGFESFLSFPLSLSSLSFSLPIFLPFFMHYFLGLEQITSGDSKSGVRGSHVLDTIIMYMSA